MGQGRVVTALRRGALLAAICAVVAVANSSGVGAELTPEPPSSVGISDAVVATAKQSVGIVKLAGWRGTGWIAAPGVVVTDYHVAEVATNQQTFRLNGSTTDVDCYTVVANPALDIAVLRCSDLDAPPLPLRSEPVALDTPVFAVGYPGGEHLMATGGVVTSLGEQALGSSRLGYRVYVIPGSSGSPVMDERGHVVSTVIGTDFQHAVGSRASEIRPLVALGDDAPSSITMAVIELAAWRSLIPAVAMLLIAGFLCWRAGGRWVLKTTAWVAFALAGVAIFTMIQVFSVGSPVLVR